MHPLHTRILLDEHKEGIIVGRSFMSPARYDVRIDGDVEKNVVEDRIELYDSMHSAEILEFVGGHNCD